MLVFIRNCFIVFVLARFKLIFFFVEFVLFVCLVICICCLDDWSCVVSLIRKEFILGVQIWLVDFVGKWMEI